MYYPGSSPAAKRRRLSDAGLAFALPPSSRRRRRSRNARTGGFLGIETKFRDLGYGGNIATSTTEAGGEADPATALCLNATAQGDTEQSRDGRVQSNVSLDIKGVVVLPPLEADAIAAFPNGFQVFVAVVKDRQTNGAQLNSEDVFVNPIADIQASASPMLNLQNERRFKVLWSKSFKLNYLALSTDSATNATYGAAGVSAPFSCFLDLKGEKTNYITGGTTGVIANITDVSYHVIAFYGASGAEAVAEPPTLVYNSRLRFRG